MKRENLLISVFTAVLLFSVVMMLVQYSSLTGYATSGSTLSNVTIVNYLSIAMSTNLADGIQFGSVSTLPATDINASHNYDAATTSASTMFVNVSTDSNTNVDFCIKANTDLKDAAGDSIAIANEAYSNSTNSTSTTPAIANQVSLTTSYVKAGATVGLGNVTFYRAWLDIPAAQAAGGYNNSVSFEGVTAGSAC